jgi:hypothetical protein
LYNINDSYNEEMTFQIDYQNPIGTNQMLEIGAKDIMRKVFSKYTYLVDSAGNGNYTQASDARLSNNLNYNQNIIAGYFSYTYSTKTNYSFKVGSRYEYTTIDAYTQVETEPIDIPAYGALVPSINISKKIKDGKTLKLGYNRRIQRPSIRYLNPNIQASNPYNTSQGNPNLDPEYTNNFELTYSTFIKGTSLNFSGFWRNTNNGIQEVREVRFDSVIHTKYQNIGSENAVGLNLFGNVMVGKFMLNGGTDIYYAMLDNNLPVDPTNPDDPNKLISASNSGWVMSYRLFGSYNLSKGWGFQFFGFYRGREVQLQGTRGGFGIYSLGLRKDFNNKKGSIGFGAENFFTPEFKIKSESKSPVYAQESLNVLRNMSFRVNISYRFGKMSMEAPKRRRSINNDDLKEGGGDGGGQDGGGQQGVGGAQGGSGFRQGGGQSGQRPGGGAPAAAGAAAAAAPKLPPADTAAVVNVEGTWNYTIDSPQGGEGTLVLKKEGDKYTGTINNKRFNRENPLSQVSVNGNEITFSYEAGFGGNQMTISVKAIVTGDAFAGNMTVGTFGTFPINAKKAQ